MTRLANPCIVLFDSVETLFKEAGQEEHFNHLRELADYLGNMTAEELDEHNKQLEKLGQLDDDAKYGHRIDVPAAEP